MAHFAARPPREKGGRAASFWFERSVAPSGRTLAVVLMGVGGERSVAPSGRTLAVVLMGVGGERSAAPSGRVLAVVLMGVGGERFVAPFGRVLAVALLGVGGERFVALFGRVLAVALMGRWVGRAVWRWRVGSWSGRGTYELSAGSSSITACAVPLPWIDESRCAMSLSKPCWNEEIDIGGRPGWFVTTLWTVTQWGPNRSQGGFPPRRPTGSG
jgi:hypothetical protein